MDDQIKRPTASQHSSKSRELNNFGASFFVLVLVIMLIFNGMDWYERAFTEVQNEFTDNFAIFPSAKIDFGLKKVYNLYMWATNRRIINDVVVMNDGRLILRQGDAPPSYDEKINNIVALKDYLESKDIPMLFVRVPDKMQDTSQLPQGYANTILEDGVSFMAQLSQNGVASLDLREEMMRENMDFATAFYRGDHHWTAETALWSFGKIATVMNTEYGFSLDEDTWDAQSYEKITYQNVFMGSESERIGDPGLKEDITVLIPRFETAFTVNNINEYGQDEAALRGDFTDVFVPKTKEAQHDDFSQYDLNAADSGFARYINENAAEQKKVLLIADSFGRVFSTYLACSTAQVSYLSISEENNMKLYPVLADEEFDMVIFMVYDQVLLRDNEELGKNRLYFGEDQLWE